MTTAETAVVKRLQADPALFCDRVLHAGFYGRQDDYVRALRDHNRIAVLGANSTGKDYATGRLVWWWLTTRYPAKVVILAPTHRQVHDVVWREVRQAHAEAAGIIGGHMYPRASRWEYDDEHFMLGFAVGDALAIQGFHSPNLLAVLSEAHGIEQLEIESVKRLNPAALVMTGNPLSADGEFHDAFHELSDLYHTIQISAFDTPLDDPLPGMVTRGIIEERKIEWGEDSPLYRASILGEWAEGLDGALVTLSEANAARARTAEPHEKAILGVDVARFGGDASVIYRRAGPVARLVYRGVGVDTMRLIAEIQKSITPDVSEVIIDAVGVGAGVYDRMKELDLPVRLTAFQGGAAARDKSRYFNATAECWWGMAQAFRRGVIDIEDDRRLIAQITARTYVEQSDRTIRLESKDDMRKRGGRSPDEADALAMTYWSRRRARNPLRGT